MTPTAIFNRAGLGGELPELTFGTDHRPTPARPSGDGLSILSSEQAIVSTQEVSCRNPRSVTAPTGSDASDSESPHRDWLPPSFLVSEPPASKSD
jgi:hypothetical protein